ncbi:MAG: sulfite exporter TauE/SafE family protein, partial [bacterium]
MNKQIIKIKGMHCRSCEILLREKLEEIDSVQNVTVSYKRSEAAIYSKTPIAKQQILDYVKEAGYAVGKDESKLLLSQNPKTYLNLGISILLIFILYTVANRFGLFGISIGSSNNASNLLVVLLVGLTAGVSTCMAMSGGLILGIAARHSEKNPEATSIQKFRPHLYFNLGRILSYFLLGGTIGLIGKAFQLSGTTLGILSIAVGLVMIILGLQLTEIFPRLTNGQITLPSGLAKLLGMNRIKNQEYSHLNSAVIGALTFFLPCGFTQAMQLYALNSG